IGSAYNDTELTIMQKLFADASAATYRAGQELRANDTPANQQAFLEALTRQTMAQSMFARGTAEAGRAERALHKIQEFWTPEAEAAAAITRESTGRTLFQMKDMARLMTELKTPEQVAAFVANSQKHTFGRMLLEYWINGLISGPATHTTY